MYYKLCIFDMRKKNSSNCPEKAKIGGIDYQNEKKFVCLFLFYEQK